MGLTFFGLTLKSAPEVRKVLFRQIHEIVFHGKGGYDWSTVYNMPIWLRRFHIQSISEYNKDQNEKVEKAKKGNQSSKTPLGPNINPSSTYNFKK